jgi:hypothetical protein
MVWEWKGIQLNHVNYKLILSLLSCQQYIINTLFAIIHVPYIHVVIAVLWYMVWALLRANFEDNSEIIPVPIALPHVWIKGMEVKVHTF